MFCIMCSVIALDAIGYSLTAYEKQVHDINIPESNVVEALNELALQTGVAMLFPYRVAKARKANAVVGRYTLKEALTKLLQGSGLVSDLTENGVINISTDKNGRQEPEGKTSMNTNNTLLASILSVFLGAASVQPVVGQEDTGGGITAKKTIIEEIIVTANKREQRLQDVATSITALRSEDIERQGLIGMGDYLSTIPGVAQQDFGVGQNKLVIRGIGSSISEDASVGMYFGEVPLATVAAGFSTVDVKLVDIEQIEVLRGPQGTLYGSGSMGGTVRVVPTAPDLEKVEAKIKAGYSVTEDTGGDNYNVEGVINFPLIKDELAIRLVAYHFDNSGFIDNVIDDPARTASAALFGATEVAEEGVGDTKFSGFRASMLWKPTDRLNLTLAYMRQDLTQHGFEQTDLNKNEAYHGARWDLGALHGNEERRIDDFEFINLVAEFESDWGTFLSSSVWTEGAADATRDISRGFPLALGDENIDRRDGFVQEFRFASTFDGPFQIVAGVYYEDLERTFVGNVYWIGDPALLPAFGLGTDPEDIIFGDQKFSLEQYAVFGEVSYELIDDLILTFGGRWFDYERRDIDFRSGVLSGGDSTTDSTTSEQDTSFKANISYALDDDKLLYAQWTQGFRLGKPTPPIPAGACDLDNDGFLDGTVNVPVGSGSLEADSLDSYELGGKFGFFDNTLVVNTSFYHIDWSGIPVSVFPTCGFTIQINAGDATSKGVEFESTYFITSALRANFGFSYIDITLDQDVPQLNGLDGDRLPGSPKVNTTFGLQYDFQLAGMDSFVSADYAFIGGYYFDVPQQTTRAGDYGKLDMRAGMTFNNNISLSLYGHNLTNSDGLTLVLNRTGGYRLRPRTIGFEVGYRY